MKPNARRSVTGFTLIELMTVITIMVVLAAVTVAGVSFVNEYQAKKKAQIDIELLSKAIEEYKLDIGFYPGLDENSPAEGDISEELYQALFLDGYLAQTSPGPGVAEVKIYIPELDPRNRRQTWVTVTYDSVPGSAALKIFDPWKRPYRYRKGQNAQNPDFDLWSLGKDGLTDPNNPARTVKGNADDIRNF